MVNNYFLLSTRLQKLFKDLGVEDLRGNRRTVYMGLVRIYEHPCDIPLSEIDYDNIFNILMLLHKSRQGLGSNIIESVKEQIERIRKDNSILPVVLQEFIL